jgi:hypothetical protein
MAMDFSSGAGAASAFDLIQNGQLAFANLSVRGHVLAPTGSKYVDCELTIDANQPFAGRKIFEKIGDPFFEGNSEKYRQMGMTSITRILEAARGAGPNNPDGYKLDNFSQLDGLRVPIKIGIEKGTDGHDDKNRVGEFLTPNPASQSGHKLYLKLLAGEFSPGSTKAPAAPVSGFGAPAGGNGAPAATGGFGNASAAQPAASGFGNAGQGGQPAAPNPFGQQPAGSANAAATNAATSASPSDPAATPGWLEQSGGAPSN